jgi:hypothetical protein
MTTAIEATPWPAGQALGQRQRHIAVEAKGRLRAAGMQPPVHPRQPQQRIGQADARPHHGQPRGGQGHRGIELERIAHNRVEQQARKQQVVHQPFRAIPHRPVQRRVAAQEVAQQDEPEVRKQQQGVGHAQSIPKWRVGPVGGPGTCGVVAAGPSHLAASRMPQASLRLLRGAAGQLRGRTSLRCAHEGGLAGPLAQAYVPVPSSALPSRCA